MAAEEIYISVDIEASGPIPGEYSILSIGASVVGEPTISFYAELKPLNENAIVEALRISQFDMKELGRTGEDAETVMQAFRNWIIDHSGERKPVFVGFNASFDWSFINWYFHKYLGENPFGFGALDIKAYYMGLSRCKWSETTTSQLPTEFQPEHKSTHNALDDAKAQAEIFDKLLSGNRTGIR